VPNLQQSELTKLINEAKERVYVGAIYTHYKDADKRYKVIDLAIDVDNNEVRVVYRALYGDHLTFVRTLAEWCDTINGDGKSMSRFTLMSRKEDSSS
jgi:hypothetical protein